MSKRLADYFARSQAPPARMVRAWNAFWFTPADPTVLGLIRVTCGLVTLYTIFCYSFSLQDFMGEHAWYDLKLRTEVMRDQPQRIDALDGQENVVVRPTTPKEEDDFARFRVKHGFFPTGPYPESKIQADFVDEYARIYKADLRVFGLEPPETSAQWKYLIAYTDKHNEKNKPLVLGPPPAYELDPVKQAEIDEYIYRFGVDPRRNYARGSPIWSMWFHVTNPTAMAIVHGLVVFVVFFFTIGFCTRITSVLTWMGSLWYIHRNTIIVFGVDTMMVILLLYLAIGHCGAAYSVDRLIARWWAKNKLRIVNRWRALWSRPPLSADQIQPAAYSAQPQPSISANFAIRLLQVHTCVIYLIAGLSKLQGQQWWNGTAVWGTLANYEFAPMQHEAYVWFLRALGTKLWIWHLFLLIAGLFSLVFEISYAFLVWRPSLRWLILFGAIMLHGCIGLFMGLKTFSLLMLVMNMAFVRPEEVRNVFGWFRSLVGAEPGTQPRSRAMPEVASTARPMPEPAAVGSSHIKHKK